MRFEKNFEAEFHTIAIRGLIVKKNAQVTDLSAQHRAAVYVEDFAIDMACKIG